MLDDHAELLDWKQGSIRINGSRLNYVPSAHMLFSREVYEAKRHLLKKGAKFERFPTHGGKEWWRYRRLAACRWTRWAAGSRG